MFSSHVEQKKTLSSKLSEVQDELRSLKQQKQSAEDKINDVSSWLVSPSWLYLYKNVTHYKSSLLNVIDNMIIENYEIDIAFFI